MDRSAVKMIVDREIEPLMGQLGIAHWKIRFSYDLRAADGDSTTVGQCNKLVDYNSAAIALDPDGLDDEADVLRILRHELFHIVLAPFDVLTNALSPLVEKDATLCGIMESIRTHAVEKAVINLERMWHCLTNPPTPTTLDGSYLMAKAMKGSKSSKAGCKGGAKAPPAATQSSAKGKPPVKKGK